MVATRRTILVSTKLSCWQTILRMEIFQSIETFESVFVDDVDMALLSCLGKGINRRRKSIFPVGTLQVFEDFLPYI